MLRNKLICVRDSVFVLTCTGVYTVHWVHHFFLAVLFSLCIMDFLKNHRPGPLFDDHVLDVTSSSSCLFLAVSSLSARSWKASWASLSLSSHSSWCRCLQREHNETLQSAEPPDSPCWHSSPDIRTAESPYLSWTEASPSQTTSSSSSTSSSSGLWRSPSLTDKIQAMTEDKI